MSRRIKTKYPGVYYRKAKRLGGKGAEKVYYIVFKKNGKSHEEKVGRQFADDLTPARVAGIRAERIEGKRLSRKEIKALEEAQKREAAEKWTIERLWEEYIANNPNLKGIKTYTSNYNLYIGPNFGNREPRDILPLDVDRLRLKLLKKRAPQTVQHVLELLRRIVNFGVRKKLCDGLNFKVEMPEVDNIKIEDLNSEQLNALLKAIDEDVHPHAGPMMKMVLFTGMRRGELFRLKWEDINFDRGFINIVDPKGGPSQVIPLNDAARDFLSSHIKTGSPYVFPGRNGGQRVNIAKQVNRIKKNAGLPKNFRPLHGLRHVFASSLASSGEVGLYALQKLLTHKDSKMTQRYAHLRDEALKRASEVAGNIIQKATNTKDDQNVVNLEDHKN
jgi:integrase